MIAGPRARIAAGMFVLGVLVAAGFGASSNFGQAQPAQAPEEAAVPAAPEPPSRVCAGAEQLARRYAPALALAPGDQSPRPVEMLLDRATLVYHDGDQRAMETGVNSARLALLSGRPDAFLELPPAVDDPAGQRRLYEEAVASDRAGRYAVTAYASVHCDANAAEMNGFTVVQYWLFYLYNDYYNRHEGDWELIQVVLSPDRRPLYAAYAQHNTYTWRDWSEVLIESRVDPKDPEQMMEHPKVYVARGSHASYFQYAPGGYGGDTVSDATELVVPQVRLLPVNEEAEPATFGWLRFPGAWGSDVSSGQGCRGCQRGPVGPAFNAGGSKWKTPLAWGGRRLTRDDLIANRTARIVVRTKAAIHVYDAQNRHSGPLPGGRQERAAGVAVLTRPGSDRHILLAPGLDTAATARVEFEGSDVSGLEVLLPESGGALYADFAAVTLGPSGRARLVLSGGLSLLVDADGDGRYERRLAPHSVQHLTAPPADQR